MIAIWFLALVIGASTLIYGSVVAGWGLVGSVIAALFMIVFVRGVFSWITRSLVVRDKLEDRGDTTHPHRFSQQRGDDLAERSPP